MTAPSTPLTTAARASCPSDLRPSAAQITALIDVEWNHLINDRPTPAWEEAQQAFAAFQRALAAGHRGRAQAQLLKLAALLDAGAAERRGTEYFIRLVEQKRRLIAAHARMLHAAGQRLTPEDIGVLTNAMWQAAATAVSDPVVLAQIVTRCQALLHRLNTPPAAPTRHRESARSWPPPGPGRRK